MAATAARPPASLQRPPPGRSPAEIAWMERRLSLVGSIDAYEKREKLGHGTHGVVRKAIHRRTGKPVAVKRFLHGDAVGEATCMIMCHGDPAIVEMVELAEVAGTGRKFLVMELVDGGSLRERIRDRRSRSERTTRAMMRQLVGAAKTMHDAGVIHRDIKPKSILLTPLGALKICDFGLATLVKPAGEPYEKERVGTLIYSSPEQLRGSRYYGTAVDMWALGCVMFELVTGDRLLVDKDARTPQAITSDLSLRLRVASALEGLKKKKKLSEAGLEVLAGLLEFNPDERLTAMAALEHRWFRAKHTLGARIVDRIKQICRRRQ